MNIFFVVLITTTLLINNNKSIILDVPKCNEVFSETLLIRMNQFFTNTSGENKEDSEPDDHSIIEINPPKLNSSSDECHWKLNFSEVSPFEDVLITYGEAFTDGFDPAIRDDSKKIISGEGYSFYVYSKEKNEQNTQEEQDTSNKMLLLQLQDSLSVFFNERVGTSKSTIENFSDGYLFHISFEVLQQEINLDLLDTKYIGKCDLIFESIFSLMESIFGFDFENKEDIHLVDHRENLINFCAANFDILKTEDLKKLQIFNKPVPDMKHLIFREQATKNQALEYSQFLDRTISPINFPIKNFKLYFEKIRKVNSEGQPLHPDLEEDIYYTMNFHIFLYNEYGEKIKMEKGQIDEFVMRIERVYCLNFKCENGPNNMQLNFLKENRDVNPEHFYYVNYFKPAHITDHIKRLEEVSPLDHSVLLI